MPKTVVWNQLGATVGETISSAVPEVEVVNIEKDPRQIPEPKGSVLFATPRRDVPREALPFVDVSWAAGVEWVHAAPTGIDQFPQALFENKTVTCGRGLSGSAIADFVLAAVLAFEKQLPEIWSESAAPAEATVLGRLEDRTLGVFGLGAIGREVAVRARAFGMAVVATRRTGKPSDIDGVTIVGLDELLAVSDHLVLAAPSTDLTVHLLDVGRLQKVKRGVHVVNVARGTLVDNDALVDALERGHVSRATLDVTEPEPLPRDDPLRRHPLARVSDHVSGRVAGVGDRLVGLFVDNLRRFLAGQPLLGVVDWELGY